MKTSRNSDLEILETARDATNDPAKRARRNALLESVYMQSKDSTLEKIKRELTQWIIYGLNFVPENNLPPTIEQQRGMAKAQSNIDRLEKAAQDYAKSPAFLNDRLKRMNRHDPVKVSSIITKQQRRLE